MGNGVTNDRTAQHWFARFKEGDFNLDDLPRSGRPVEFDLDLLKQIIEEDPRVTTRQLAEQFKCHHSTIADYLHDLGKTWKYGVWVPHELSNIQTQS